MESDFLVHEKHRLQFPIIIAKALAKNASINSCVFVYVLMNTMSICSDYQISCTKIHKC